MIRIRTITRRAGSGVFILGALVTGCGPATVQQSVSEPEPTASAIPADLGAAASDGPDVEPPRAAVQLPPEVASLVDEASIARFTRRAWVERRGAIRFVRDGSVRAALDEDPLRPEMPNVVVDVVDQDVRVMHAWTGLRVLVWTNAGDLTNVPTEVVAVRASRTADAPANDAAGARVFPGFRLSRATTRGDLVEFTHSDTTVSFRGFVPVTSLGPVFVPAAPPEREGEATRIKSDAALRDRPNGRVIAQFSPHGEGPAHFDYDVLVVGAEERGHRLVVYRNEPAGDRYGAAASERFEILGWARTRDLGLEPMYGGLSGRGYGTAPSTRTLLIRIPAGTPIRDLAGGTIIGVAYEDALASADPAPEGGFVFDLDSPWGRLALFTAEGTVQPREAPAATP